MWANTAVTEPNLLTFNLVVTLHLDFHLVNDGYKIQYTIMEKRLE